MGEPREIKRVGILSIFHESNTFIPAPTTLAHYRESTFLEGHQVTERYALAHHEIGGFLEVLAAAGIEAVPIFCASTAPWGAVTDEALDEIWKIASERLRAAGRLDGILAAPHGAAVNESRPDMDGWWLNEVRKIIGPEIPLIATMDPHGNLSPAMVGGCDALIAYRQNPHLDQRQCGIEAGELMVKTLAGKARPVMAGAFPPISINIERQLTFAEPLLSLQRELDKTLSLPGILSASLALGFPYADVSDMGSAFVVVADARRDLAEAEVNRLAEWLVEHRELFRGEMISPSEALAEVPGSPKPVGLLDMGDNVGGGAPGDSTILARLCRSCGFRTLFYLPDPDSVAVASAAGVGGRVRLRVGGKLPMTPDPPMEFEGTVTGLHGGSYTETKPRHGGQAGGDMGPTAIVRADDGFTLMLMSRRGGPNFTFQPILACGLDPADFEVIIIKGVHAPVGAYSEICGRLIRVDTPGVTTANMESLVYHHRRRPMYPFEPISGVRAGGLSVRA